MGQYTWGALSGYTITADELNAWVNALLDAELARSKNRQLLRRMVPRDRHMIFEYNSWRNRLPLDCRRRCPKVYGNVEYGLLDDGSEGATVLDGFFPTRQYSISNQEEEPEEIGEDHPLFPLVSKESARDKALLNTFRHFAQSYGAPLTMSFKFDWRVDIL
ncbi:hypothetical protein BKA70DRAFT_1430622 [Coprinopsis sp. MPI-PUGE-AT-0042]|nr:hypothetical protein BKA70DRAFT_1430622 [Coprinopsis sp. MPI-PUGE-AT-0042]